MPSSIHLQRRLILLDLGLDEGRKAELAELVVLLQGEATFDTVLFLGFDDLRFLFGNLDLGRHFFGIALIYEADASGLFDQLERTAGLRVDLRLYDHLRQVAKHELYLGNGRACQYPVFDGE